jgi:hypothetical protein
LGKPVAYDDERDESVSLDELSDSLSESASESVVDFLRLFVCLVLLRFSRRASVLPSACPLLPLLLLLVVVLLLPLLLLPLLLLLLLVVDGVVVCGLAASSLASAASASIWVLRLSGSLRFSSSSPGSSLFDPLRGPGARSSLPDRRGCSWNVRP